jgi:hypothetical protein
MSWKKYGGIEHFDSQNNIRTHSLTTDNFTLLGTVYGVFTISGLLHLNNDAIIQTKNYMKHYNILNGLIVNFGQSKSGLGIILISNGVVHDFVNGNWIARIELTL